VRVHAARLEPHDLVRIGDTVLRFADRGALTYCAYRLDGSVIAAMRPVRHSIRSQLASCWKHGRATRNSGSPTTSSLIKAGRFR